MRPHYTLVTPASSEPITLAQATEHLRVDSTDDIALVESLIPVGREIVEGITGRVALESEWRLIARTWADLCPDSPYTSAFLHRTPLVSVESVKYYAEGADTLTTMSAADYAVITASEPGMIHFKETLPSVEDRPDAIQIEFTAGHTAVEDAPAVLKHAMKMLVAHFYETRTPIAFASSSEIPYTLQFLLNNQRVRGWLA